MDADINSSWLLRGSARSGAVLGSISARIIAEKVDFAEPCSPERTNTGYGPVSRNVASSQATIRAKVLSLETFRQSFSMLIDPPLSGMGMGCIPAARRK